jgi:hypothetical protein
VRRKQGEIDPFPIPMGAARMRQSLANIHASPLSAQQTLANA